MGNKLLVSVIINRNAYEYLLYVQNLRGCSKGISILLETDNLYRDYSKNIFRNMILFLNTYTTEKKKHLNVEHITNLKIAQPN